MSGLVDRINSWEPGDWTALKIILLALAGEPLPEEEGG